MKISWIVIPLGIVAYFLISFGLFSVLLNSPKSKMIKLAKKIESDVAVTGRRLLIQLESGKSLQRAIIDIAKKSKGSTGSIEMIACELYMGKSLEKAISDSIKNSPSDSFKKIFTQVKNSLRTGSDLKKTLKAILAEINRNKIVEFESFSKKLNPMCMFYMFAGTVLPSLGAVIISVVLAIMRIKISFVILGVFLFLILIIQVVFIMVFFNSRPQLDI